MVMIPKDMDEIPGREDLLEHVKEVKKEDDVPSVRRPETVVDIALWVAKNDPEAGYDGIRTARIRENVDDATDTYIRHARDHFELIKVVNGGSNLFIVHDRYDWMNPVYEANWNDVQEDVDALLDHCREDGDVLAQAADGLDVEASIEAVEEKLSVRGTELVNNYEEAYDEIDSLPVITENHGYGPMRVVSSANRYAASFETVQAEA